MVTQSCRQLILFNSDRQNSCFRCRINSDLRYGSDVENGGYLLAEIQANLYEEPESTEELNEELEELKTENAALAKRLKYVNQQCCRALIALGISVLDNTPYEVFGDDDADTGAVMYVTKYLLENIINMMVLVGAIKMSNHIAKEIMGG